MNENLPQSSHDSSNSFIFVVVFFFVLFLVIITAGALYYFYSQEKQQSVRRSTPTQSVSPILPTATPTATPTPVLERSNLQISVLNGSGTVGAARGISTHLTNLGYTIRTIGNASGFAYRDITIKIKKEKESYLPILQKDLEGQPTVSSISATIDDTIPVDAQVIVGR